MQTTMKRSVNGLLLLNKPLGLSSNAALQQVKRLFVAKKAGHGGSLDPLATGMLPIFFGRATKYSSCLLSADKVYEVEGQLGITTTTGDREGDPILSKPVPSFTRGQIEAVLQQFHGVIDQIPPMYSAIKHQGRRLYQLAREGVTIERKPRQITIHEIILMDLSVDRLRLRVRCSKGTYIRTLIEDIGAMLEGVGAHVTYLHRLSVGHLSSPMLSMTMLQTLVGEGMEQLDNQLLSVEKL